MAKTGDLLKDWEKSWEKEENKWKMALKEKKRNYTARTTIKNIAKKSKKIFWASKTWAIPVCDLTKRSQNYNQGGENSGLRLWLMRVDGERHKPKSYCRLWYHLCYNHRTSQGMWFKSVLMGGPDCICECSVGKVAGKRAMVQVLGKSCSFQLCKLKLHQPCKLHLPLAVKGDGQNWVLETP